MAYARPPYDARPPYENERQSLWDSTQPPQYGGMPPSRSAPPAPTQYRLGSWDAESEDSDVSANPGEPSSASFTVPAPLPTPVLKHAAESSDAVQSCLNQLTRLEDSNITRHQHLKEKRARKDERIRRKREAQDAQIKAMMDARARRDSRIVRRREREDAAFQRFHDELEEEESRLRHRLRRLKRGLPVDSLASESRRVSSTSTSPPPSTYSTIPHPAKRHQTGPPGYSGVPSSTASYDQRVYSAAPPAPAASPSTTPSYSFYNPLPSTHSYPSSHPSSQYTDTSPAYAHNSASPAPRGPHPPNLPTHHVRGPSPSAHSTATPATHVTGTTPSARQTSSSYDTRPPPPASSGFAPINPPQVHPQPGFTPVNAHRTATPSEQSVSSNKEPGHAPAPRTVDHAPPPRPHDTEETPTRVTSVSTASTNKRTPSTTHPYQMSEAFANRHHPCERVDALNRGIWTWYGAGGTQENPTATPREMYLKCNHDSCGRIDWRTVHGLQCHIVKNHDQPKGTIGSLEKALEKYGIPVTDIDEIEKRDGLGSGGMMTELKKLQPRKRDVERVSTPGPQSSPSPAIRSQALPFTPASTGFTNRSTTSDRYGGTNGEGTPLAKQNSRNDREVQLSHRPNGGFAAVNSGWTPVNNALHIKPTEPNDRDQKMHDAPPPTEGHVTDRGKPAAPAHSPPRPAPPSEPFWPSWQTPTDQPQAGPHSSPAIPNGSLSVSAPSKDIGRSSNPTLSDRTTVNTRELSDQRNSKNIAKQHSKPLLGSAADNAKKVPVIQETRKREADETKKDVIVNVIQTETSRYEKAHEGTSGSEEMTRSTQKGQTSSSEGEGSVMRSNKAVLIPAGTKTANQGSVTDATTDTIKEYGVPDDMVSTHPSIHSSNLGSGTEKRVNEEDKDEEDEEGDVITVVTTNKMATVPRRDKPRDKERENDRELMKTPPRRLPNGRFVKRGKS